MSNVATATPRKAVKKSAKSAKKTLEKPVETPAAVNIEPSVNPENPVKTVVNDGPVYTGPLPTHEGKPVFIERNAWAFYMNPCAYGVRHERIRNYLMQQDAFALAEAMGRPLTVDDLKILVQLDGEGEVECHVSGRRFRPLNWTLILPSVLQKIREGKTLAEMERDGELLAVGHFIYNKGNIIALGGTPYRWKDGFDKDQLNFASPVTVWWNKAGHRWPNTFGQVSRMNEARIARREERAAVDNKIGSLLDEWNPGGNRHQGRKPKAYHHGGDN